MAHDDLVCPPSVSTCDHPARRLAVRAFHAQLSRRRRSARRAWLDVSYETVRRWVSKFGPISAAQLRKRRPKPHSIWHRSPLADQLPVCSGGRERDHIRKAVEILTEIAGSRPLGWYTGRTSPNTRRLVAEYGGFLYDADDYNDDLPYWSLVEGKRQLIVPYTLDANDMRASLLCKVSTRATSSTPTSRTVLIRCMPRDPRRRG